MEPPQRGGDEEEQLAWGESASGTNSDAAASCCLCPAAAGAGAAPSASGSGPFAPPRLALEQEVLRRADLQLLNQQHQGGGDRRRERRMKNRESAARSRLRRHAYVSELEKEVELLRAENKDLRRLCEQLKEAAAEAPATMRAPHQQLQRTSSAPPLKLA